MGRKTQIKKTKQTFGLKLKKKWKKKKKSQTNQPNKKKQQKQSSDAVWHQIMLTDIVMWCAWNFV